MWNLPGSGIKPVSPTLASGFFTTLSFFTTWSLSHQGSPEKQFLKKKLGRNKRNRGKKKIKDKIGKVNKNMENK